MWAACFSPVWRGQLRGEQTTTLTWTRALPRATTALLTAWTVVLFGWMTQLVPEIQAGATSPVLLGFWALLAGGTVMGPVVGTRFGGAALEAELPYLLDAATTPAVEEDW
jgi:predicted anti-sigma-YlaC factor YlaD